MIDELNKVQEEGEDKQPLQEELNEAGDSLENEADVDGGDEAEELNKLQHLLGEANDKFLRLYAEFDNYKRRTMKEKAEILQTAGKDVMLSLLPVIDDFERAQKSQSTTDFEAYKQGVDLIYNKFNGILQARGLKAIESVGEEFNVDLHEAITNIPAPSEDLKGKVVDETEKGYTLNGHVIRFAKVIVGE